MSYLNETHPEVFAVNPRPGGAIKIKRPELNVLSKPSSTRNVAGRVSRTTMRSTAKKASKVTIKSTGVFESKLFRPTAVSTPRRTTREYRIKKILSSSPWLLFDDDEEPDNVLPPDPVHDAMTILSAAISTIMLMASDNQNIPKEHMIWTLSYLECVKDDYGNYPPNVRGMMNHMKLIDNTLLSFFDLDDDTKSDVIGGLGFNGQVQIIPTTPVAARATPNAPVEAAPDALVEAAPDAPVGAAPDAPVEAAPDAQVEAAPDAAVEAAPDAPVEAAANPPVEAAPDAPVEAAPDAPVEAAPDAPVEAAPDAPVEAAPDAPVEAAPDAPVEAAPDAPVEAAPEEAAP